MQAYKYADNKALMSRFLIFFNKRIQYDFLRAFAENVLMRLFKIEGNSYESTIHFQSPRFV
jgi:hypothetical protein